MLCVRIPFFIALCAVLASGVVCAADDVTGVNGTCLDCHTNAGYLMQTVAPPPSTGEDSCAAAPTRPPFLGSFVNPAFAASTHGQLGCTSCHGGDATAKDAATAHAGLTPATGTCADCHEEVSALYATSLHNTLGGMAHALKLRSGEANFHKLDQMWANDCQTCHASCADCHLTLPGAVGGGLIKGHEFFKRPPMEDTCAVCHGSRAGGEYLGTHEGLEPDVHFKAGMHCLDCHKNNLHGDGQKYTERWHVEGRPLCTDCHPALPNDQVREHSGDHANVSCQVCHAQPYQNCFACHSEITDEGYKRQAGRKDWTLKIGDNTVEGYPYSIVPVRKNPVARNSFSSFGPDLLPMFDNHPTWKTAAPHNIVRNAAQSKRCSGCHDSEDLYLNKPNSLDP